MDQEFWTSEHADMIEDNFDEAQRILDVLNQAQEEHEKGGLYFKTTKKLLEVYRPLRFDAVNEKVMKTVESIDAYEEKEEKDFFIALDNILSMPGIYDYYSKEIGRFVTSSSPVTMGLFVHIIDAGIRLLSFTERNDDNELKYSDILKASYIDEKKDPHSLVEQLHTNWATFYRKKNEAITALSIIIFGPIGGRHPSSLYDDNQLKKKFGRFVKMADDIDTICSLADVTQKHEQNKI